MDNRAAKLALARKKLKDHQEKKTVLKEDVNFKSEVSMQEGNKITSYMEPNVQNVEDLNTTPNNEGTTASINNESVASTTIYTEHFTLNSIPNDAQITEENNISVPLSDINAAEILISNKRTLELQVHDLLAKLSQLEHNHLLLNKDYKLCNQKVSELQNELKDINSKYSYAMQEMMMKDTMINGLNATKSSMLDEKTNFLEQLEFTKSILNTKEAANEALSSQLYGLQNQYDVLYLQLQQLTNGSLHCPPSEKPVDNEKNEAMMQKITNLEQQVSLLHKERDQLNLHYEHYVAELNEQLRSAIKNNENLNKEVQDLSNRENSLVEQISDMEIRIQNYNVDKKRLEMDQNTSNIQALKHELKQVQDNFNNLQSKYSVLQSQLATSEAKVKELSELKEEESNNDSISISKLSADMTSDKIAAQRATEQNKKMKQDLQGLEDAFVKMSKDKLELTEKLTAEKFLNRELTLKLAEVEEKSKDVQVKLKAKDEEMIRLQSNYREIEKQCEHLKAIDRNSTPTIQEESANVNDHKHENNNDVENDCHGEHEHLIEVHNEHCHNLQKQDAMSKLQERFLKIMGEVADLSDEKHRLEHIILQLQNETDTICEYVALYQQQRSLLKRRDEERSAQLKVFQQECGKLKCELEELSGILARFAEDKDLLSYFQVESRRSDMERVMNLLTNLKNNSLIDTRKKNVEFKNFYPCNCCSGKLLNV